MAVFEEGTMRIAALVGLALLVGGCHPAPRKSPPPLVKKQQQLKVVTFNVNYAGVDMARAAQVLRKADADVVALQETTPAWERYLRRRLRARYPVQRYRHAGGAGGLAFLSRYPLRSLKVIRPPARGWFPAWLVRVRTPLGRVLLLNVHLRPPIGNSGRLSTVPSAYFYTRSIRKREIRRHLDRAPGDRPLVVLGDFNESGGPALRLMRKRGLRSALARFDSTTPTWRWKTSLYTFRSRLDHVFFSKHLRCVGAQVLGDAASDHYPVEAVFALHAIPGP
jgi:endonuclease/exonuclease/phosphatase family metal-dependent hydrolase